MIAAERGGILMLAKIAMRQALVHGWQIQNCPLTFRSRAP
jgi:hypothetical protein